jgi:hypothetical protein
MEMMTPPATVGGQRPPTWPPHPPAGGRASDPPPLSAQPLQERSRGACQQACARSTATALCASSALLSRRVEGTAPWWWGVCGFSLSVSAAEWHVLGSGHLFAGSFRQLRGSSPGTPRSRPSHVLQAAQCSLCLVRHRTLSRGHDEAPWVYVTPCCLTIPRAPNPSCAAVPGRVPVRCQAGRKGLILSFVRRRFVLLLSPFRARVGWMV